MRQAAIMRRCLQMPRRPGAASSTAASWVFSLVVETLTRISLACAPDSAPSNGADLATHGDVRLCCRSEQQIRDHFHSAEATNGAATSSDSNSSAASQASICCVGCNRACIIRDLALPAPRLLG